MPRLDQAVKNNLKVLEREAEKNFKATIKIDSLKTWKGRKIISVKDWEKMAHQYQYRDKWLKFIPDDFISPAFFHKTENVDQQEERAKWYNDWREFLELKQNPLYGKNGCGLCALNPTPFMHSPGIGKILSKCLENYPEYKLPCTVVNLFNCPYIQGGKVDFVLKLGYYWKILDEALRWARGLSSIYGRTIDADFEEDSAWTSGFPKDRMNKGHTLEKFLGELEFPDVPIRGNEDIYHALTDKKKLDWILEQYIEFVETGRRHRLQSKEKVKEIANGFRETKGIVIDILTDIKDKITLEDLGDLYEEIREGIPDSLIDDGLLRIATRAVHEGPDRDPNLPSFGNCFLCEEFSIIHCVNCHIWMCPSHWKKHGTDFHKKKYNQI